MKTLFVLIAVLLLALPNTVNAKEKSNEVEICSTYDRLVYNFDINGRMELPISTYGKVGGLVFYTTGDVIITNRRTGEQFSSSVPGEANILSMGLNGILLLKGQTL